jgi:hypothetical protein
MLSITAQFLLVLGQIYLFLHYTIKDRQIIKLYFCTYTVSSVISIRWPQTKTGNITARHFLFRPGKHQLYKSSPAAPEKQYIWSKAFLCAVDNTPILMILSSERSPLWHYLFEVFNRNKAIYASPKWFRESILCPLLMVSAKAQAAWHF